MARVRGSQIYSPDIVEELKTAMAIESRAGEDDEITFRQKMNALQRFLNHGMSRFSIDTWHHALTILFHTYHPYRTTSPRLYTDKPLLTKLSGLEDLRVLSRDVILQREGGSLRETDAQALKHLENFMAALHCVKEAKACIADLHAFLYRYYYDPDAGRENTHVQSGKALSRANTLHAAHGGQEAKSYEVSAKQFGILTLQQMSGSTGHKLRRTVSDMKQIMARWDRLMADGQIQPEDLDAESQEDLHMLTGTAAFEPVLRLLPDIFAKYYKCLELLKQWWVLAHEIYPDLPINRPPTPPSQDLSEESKDGRLSRVDSEGEQSVVNTNDSIEETVPLSEQLQTIEYNIVVKEDLLQSLNAELRLLEERDRHFESLVEAYEKITAELEEQTRKRKELGAVREKETLPPHNQMLDVSRSESLTLALKPHDNVEELNEQVARADRGMQMLQFQQSLLHQDYMVQLEVKPSLIRFADDLRIRIADAQNSLTEEKMAKIKLQERIEEQENTGMDSVASPADSDQNHDRDDASPQTIHGPSAAQRKLELSRLKPLREDTTGSSVLKLELSQLQTSREDTTDSSVKLDSDTASVVEPQRRKSHPAMKREDDKRTTPTNKIHRPDRGKPKKSPRTPIMLSPRTTQPQRKTSLPSTQNKTDTLLQKQLRKTQGSEVPSPKTGVRPENPTDQPSPRPHATSDPHTLGTDAWGLKLNPQLKPGQSKKLQGTQHPKGNGNDTTPRPQANPTNPANPEEDTSTVSQKFRHTAIKKTGINASQRSKPSDVTKSSATSQPNDVKDAQVDDTKKDKEAASRKPKPADSVTASRNHKPGESKKTSEVTLPNVRPGNDKKDDHKTNPKPTARNGKDVPVPPLKLTEKDEDRKRHPQSLKTNPQPLKTNDKDLNDATSRKTTQGDVRKDSKSMTSQPLKPDDKKAVTTTSSERQKPRAGEDKGDVKSNPKRNDVKKVAEVTSQKSSSTGRPNGVITKGKKPNHTVV